MTDPVRTVRIQSDGTPQDTVITLSDGKSLDKVRSASIWLEAGEVPRVDIEMWMPVVDIHAAVDAVTFTCMICGKGMSHNCADTDDDDSR